MISLIGFFGTLGGRVVAIIAILGAVAVWRAADVHKQRNVGVEKERVRVEQEGRKNDAKARTARRAAEQQPDGVLKRYYRD